MEDQRGGEEVGLGRLFFGTTAQRISQIKLQPSNISKLWVRYCAQFSVAGGAVFCFVCFPPESILESEECDFKKG